MLNRKPVAPNNRNSEIMSRQFFDELESQAISVKYPKTVNDEPSIKVYPEAGRQNSEGFGGGYRVTR
jgi:hypothetical protein